MPVVALIDSGGKSIHGWIRIDAANADEWTRRVEGKLFSRLVAVSVDGSCKNEARLSRMPGHFRAEKSRWQRVLYFNPTGGAVIHDQEHPSRRYVIAQFVVESGAALPLWKR